MHYAAMNGHELCVRFLGTRGCPAKSKNSEGSIPRQVAKDEGHKAAMKDCRKAERIEGKQKVRNRFIMKQVARVDHPTNNFPILELSYKFLKGDFSKQMKVLRTQNFKKTLLSF